MVASPWLRGASYADGALAIAGLGLAAKTPQAKLVAAAAPCSAPVPATVTGISCAAATLQVPVAAHGLPAHTICVARPFSVTDTEALWAVEIAPVAAPQDLEVCYCAERCSVPTQWRKVAG